MFRWLSAVAVPLTLVVLAVQPAVAAAQDSFSCRASAARAITADPLPGVTVEPIVANGPDAPCATDSAQVLTSTTVGPLTAAALDAATELTPGQRARAAARVTDAAVAVPGLTITANVLNAQASYECVSGQPRPGSASQVVGLTINGNAVNVPDGPMTINLGPLGTLFLNQTVQEPNRITQRAFFLDTPLTDVVIAEAIAGISGNPCAAAPVGTAPEAAPPGQNVQGERRTPASARLTTTPSSVARKIAAFGTRRCIRNSFLAVVRGRNIARVTFFLDGRRLKVDRSARFDARIRGRAGIRRITARVVFRAATRAAPRTLRMTFRRCAPKPQFTG